MRQRQLGIKEAYEDTLEWIFSAFDDLFRGTHNIQYSRVHRFIGEI
jgi:hypothetical protein